MTETSSDPLTSQYQTVLRSLLAKLERYPEQAHYGPLIAAYVFDGDESVLSQIPGNVRVGNVLYDHENMASFLSFYGSADHIPRALLKRWRNVLVRMFRSAFSGYSLVDQAGVAPWLEPLLCHQSGSSPSQMAPDRPGALAFSTLAALYQEEGLDPLDLPLLPFAIFRKGHYGVQRFAKLFQQLPGFVSALVPHPAKVRPYLLAETMEEREHALRLLTPASGEELLPYLAELVANACLNPRDLRSLAQNLVARCEPRAVYDQALIQYNGAKPDARAHLLQLAMKQAQRLEGTSLINRVRTLAAADKSELVRALIDQWENKAHAQRVAVELPNTDWAGAFTDGTLAALAQAQTELNQVIAANNVRRSDYFASRPEEDQKKWPLVLLAAWQDDDVQALCEVIKNPDPKATTQCAAMQACADQIRVMLKSLAINPSITLPALLKTIRSFFPITNAHGVLQNELTMALEARHRALGNPDLLSLASALIDMGATPHRIIQAVISRWGGFAAGWSSAARLPFFSAFIVEFAACFEPETLSHYSISRERCYKIFAELPEPRTLMVARIFELACGSTKTERAAAQAALHGLPETAPRLIAALADGKADVRAQAAIWLARMRHEAALPALEKAVRAEKNDIAKGAMLDALQRFGRAIGAYIDRSALLKDAQKLLAKPLPAELHWLNWAQLPAVRWADNASAVEPDVLRYLIVNACKQKNPEPNAVLRKYCESFEPSDRARLGEWLLGAWIAADSKPFDYERVNRQASHYASSTHAMYQRTLPPEDPNRQRTIEQLHARYILNYGHTPAGTEIASKGVLAVAAACGSAAFAAPVSRYLKAFYGTRAAQCKALMVMLAWVEHPSAIQLILAIGKRFRTKGIQEEAVKQAQLLAERNDWTLDELADRTIPTGGLDDDGVLELSFGERSFSAVLNVDAKAGAKLELRNPEGKSIAALPEPRADDDAEAAAESKKNLTLAKKEIKTAIDLQSQRLYDAMCTGRLWRFEDFDRYLNRHPIVRHLVQRLIWSTVDGVCFRPMADGTLTDVDDNALTIEAGTTVRITHDLWLNAETVKAWQAHCSDYQIKPLFQQFGKGRYQASDPNAKGLLEAKGVVMDAFNMRTRLSKMGFTRGPVEDGPSIRTYEKRLPTLGLMVELEFSGNSMPEENRKVALIELRFVRVGNSGEANQVLPLSEVAEVLLAESYFDLKSLAAEGNFDAKWQEKLGL